jgi:hypothetical protein
MTRLCVVGIALLLAACPAAASNSTFFVDAVGDAGEGPDVERVRVANDDDGRISWTIELGNRTRLDGRDTYVLWLDTDLNVRNGSAGADYAIVVSGVARAAAVARWDGGRWHFGTSQRSLATRWRGKALVAAIGRTAIGSPAQLDFAIRTTAGRDADALPDAAPRPRFQLLVSPS